MRFAVFVLSTFYTYISNVDKFVKTFPRSVRFVAYSISLYYECYCCQYTLIVFKDKLTHTHAYSKHILTHS